MSYVRHQGGYLDEVGTAVIVRQILLAIQYLKTKKIVHRDLKPENILMTSLSVGARVIVSDFGSARYIPEAGKSSSKNHSDRKLQRMFTEVGTTGYAAP